jgi:hypothetical protein
MLGHPQKNPDRIWFLGCHIYPIWRVLALALLELGWLENMGYFTPKGKANGLWTDDYTCNIGDNYSVFMGDNIWYFPSVTTILSILAILFGFVAVVILIILRKDIIVDE